ncbi:MAG: type II toxin-antitoxin system RelE/ParE family toxin [bacterium]
MIRSFRHKGLKRFYETGNLTGIQSRHRNRLRILLSALDTSVEIQDMYVPGFRLHSLKGALKGRWSVSVNGNWRLTFEFQNGNSFALDYEDYH